MSVLSLIMASFVDAIQRMYVIIISFRTSILGTVGKSTITGSTYRQLGPTSQGEHGNSHYGNPTQNSGVHGRHLSLVLNDD